LCNLSLCVYIRVCKWPSNIADIIMGLTISSVLTRLFGKKQMRILMGECMLIIISVEWRKNTRKHCKNINGIPI
jgi:hypothetical protein